MSKFQQGLKVVRVSVTLTVHRTLVQEGFLGFAHCESGTTGRSLAATILKHLSDWGLIVESLRDQECDGASNMSARLGSCLDDQIVFR